MTIPVTRKRTKRPKTRTGCRTCKSRHVKCDEARPACRRCVNGGWTCEGYEVFAQSGSMSSRMLLPDKAILPGDLSPSRCVPQYPAALTARDWYALEYFRAQMSFQLPGGLNNTSWETLALRLSHSEPCIRAAIIALGSIHRSRGPEPPSGYAPALDSYHLDFALRNYAHALSCVQKRIEDAPKTGRSQSVEVVLVSCLMFISFEILQGSYELARLHLKTGLKVLAEHINGPKAKRSGRPKICLEKEPSTALSILSQAFVCLDYDLTMSGNLNPDLHAYVEDDRTDMQAPFTSLNEARLHLSIMSNAVFRVRGELEILAREEMKRVGFDSNDVWRTECWVQTKSRTVSLEDQPEQQAEVSAVEKQVAAWSSAFAAMPTPATKADIALRLALQVQFLTTWLISACWRNMSEVKCDRCFSVFSRITSLADELLDMRPTNGTPDLNDDGNSQASIWRLVGRGSGILLALHHVATKCRDYVIRHRALDILEHAKFQEGLCSSTLLIMFTRAIVECEEERIRRFTGIGVDEAYTCRDIPEEARLIEVLMDANTVDLGFGRLLISTLRPDGSGEFDIEEHRFPTKTQTPRSNTVSPGSVGTCNWPGQESALDVI